MIDFHLGLMGSFAVLFLLLLVFLNATFFKPMMKHLDARKGQLSSDQGSAEDDQEKASKLKAEAAEILSQAKKEATAMKEEAVGAARAKAEENLELARGEIATELEKFDAGLADQEKKIKDELLGQIPLFKEGLKVKFVA